MSPYAPFIPEGLARRSGADWCLTRVAAPGDFGPDCSYSTPFLHPGRIPEPGRRP